MPDPRLAVGIDDPVLAIGQAEAAALAARKKWLVSAWAGARRGKQIPPDDGSYSILLWLAGRGFGKLLAVDTPIPTPTGWATMAELQVGDTVFDQAGKPCRVTWASAPQTPCEAYRLTFSDRSTIEACAEHQWVTWTHAERKAYLRSPYEDTTRFPEDWPAWRLRRHIGKSKGGARADADSPGPQVRTTAEIVETLTYGLRDDTNHCIPQCGALDLPDADLPIDPYVLGAWLGGGDADSGGFTCHEADQPHMRAMIEAAGFMTRGSKDPQRFGTAGLTRRLRIAGLLRNKHVPAIYLRASVPQRLALLRGLMDTDGGDADSNLVSFTNTNQALADAVEELAVSLGMKVRRDDRIPVCQGKPCARAYRVAFTPHIQAFTLPRKAERVAFDCAQGLRRHHRMIVSAEPIKGVAMRCIAVDSPHAMYLAGRAMIPTHNTAAVTQALWWEAWRCPGIIGHLVAPTLSDVRGTSFEGPAGLQAIVPAECLAGGSWETAYNKTNHVLRLSNGSVIRGFGAVEQAGRLRGPQCHILCGDELREWDKPAGNLEWALNNALFGLRLPYPDGTPGRALLATTPKGVPFLKRMMRRDDVRVVHGTSYENLANLSDTYRRHLLVMQGTQMGRQEIDAAFIDEESDQTVIKRSWVRLWPSSKPLPPFSFVIEAYDTASSEQNWDRRNQSSDPSGSIVLGVFDLKQQFSKSELAAVQCRGRYAALLLDCWTERLGLPELLEKAREQHRMRYGPRPARKSDVVLIEDASSGPGLRQMLTKWGVPAWPYSPRQSKLMRLHAAAPIIKQGGLWVVESAAPDRKGLPRNWAEPFLEQVCAFAGEGSVEHDEYVDCLSSAISYLHQRGMLDAEPDQPHIDMDAKLDADRREAEELQRKMTRREKGNPYGA